MRILGNELADTLANKAVTNESLTEDYNRIPKSVVTRELEEERVKKWQTKLDTNHQRKHNERIFPKRRRKVKNENKPHTEFHGHSNRTWENKSILTPF